MSTSERLHALDAVRAFALLLGVVFHAGFSFIPGLVPGLWAMTDSAPSTSISVLLFTSHIFRMSLFFLLAGFFGRMAFHRRGIRGFWADRGKRILVPLVVGWVVLAPTMAAVWIWGLTKTFAGTLPTPPVDLPPPPAAAFQFMHLWFLYYLFLLYVAVVAVRWLVLSLDGSGRLRRAVDAAVGGLVRTGTAALVLPLPLVVALALHPQWYMWFGIPTPDQSFIPQPVSLVGYGSAVAFGWLLHRQTQLLAHLGRLWPLHLAGAAAATVACLMLAGTAPTLAPAAPGAETIAYALGYGFAIWCWSFALIGLALRFMARPRPLVRYTADASYWIYLAHLPLVVALQVLVGQWAWPAFVKFPLVLGISLILLFASYRYLVRPTFIGQVLNGRRYPRGVPQVAPPAPAGFAVPLVPTSALASLEGVRKQYGATVALDGLDLEVRRGEVLAVLGPNGAGKSTAIALMIGLLEPDRGSVALLGGAPLDIDVRRRLGVMMQDVGLTPELRVRELVALTASYYPHPLEVDEVLALTHLEALADRRYSALSGGQKRLVQFALAICGRPSLLFLDEPTVGLDVEARETLWRTLRALVAHGCSIVLTTHYLEEAEALADRVVVLAAGRLIASGTVAEVRSLVSRKQITCTSVLDVDDVRAWPGVVSAASHAQRLQLTVVDAEAVTRRLLETDTGVRDLEIRQAGLAEAFTLLTKEAA